MASKMPMITYQFKNSDRIHTITPLTYTFKAWRLLKRESKDGFIIKDKVAWVHFKNWISFNLSLDASKANAKVIISDDFKHYFKAHIIGGNTKVNIEDESGNDLFHIESANAENCMFKVDIDGTLSYDAFDADSVDIYGKECKMKSAYVTSEAFGCRMEELNIEKLDVKAKKINIDNSSGEIETLSVENTSSLNINNSFMKIVNGDFKLNNIPTIKASTLTFPNQLKYNKGKIGNKKKGFILNEDTFSKDKCLDLGRAYLSYVLSKLKEEVDDRVDDKYDLVYEEISKDFDDLKSEYERACDNLSQIADAYEDKLQNDKVMKYFNTRK